MKTQFFSKILDYFKTLVSKSYLTSVPTTPVRFFWYWIGFLALCFIGGTVMQIILHRRKLPKFYKGYLFNVANFLIYIPFFLALFLFARLAQLDQFSKPLFVVGLSTIWLIWFIFLVYYRVVVISRMWTKYNEQKRKEEFLENGKSKSSRGRRS